MPARPTGGHVGVAWDGPEAVRRRRVGAGGKQDGGGVLGEEGGGGPGRPRVRWRHGRRLQRGRAATRPPCMGWVSASPLLLHARGGSGWGRAARAPLPWEPPARCLWPVPPRLLGVLRVLLRFDGCSGRRSGRRASAGCRLGREGVREDAWRGVPGPFRGSQATGSDGSCSLWQEGLRRPPATRPGLASADRAG